MLLRVVLTSSAVALAAAGCGHRAQAPAAATPETPPKVATPAPPEPLPRAAACVTRGAPFAVVERRLAMARRSIVTDDRRVLDPLVTAPRGGRCTRPLIVFSHGHYGDPRCCRRLTRALARAGFLVLAVHHEDRDVDRVGLQGAERVDDVLWVLDHLDLRYDHARIGLAGHSFGGVTAGETASEDPRPQAVVSLAGTAGHGTMTSTRVPTLIVTGTRDTIETVAASRTSAAAIPRTVPHELLVVQGAGHGQLVDGCAEIGACVLVERRTRAFFRRYLLGERTPEP